MENSCFYSFGKERLMDSKKIHWLTLAAVLLAVSSKIHIFFKIIYPVRKKHQLISYPWGSEGKVPCSIWEFADQSPPLLVMFLSKPHIHLSISSFLLIYWGLIWVFAGQFRKFCWDKNNIFTGKHISWFPHFSSCLVIFVGEQSHFWLETPINFPVSGAAKKGHDHRHGPRLCRKQQCAEPEFFRQDKGARTLTLW